MNNAVLSFGLIFLIVSVGSLIAKFFDIGSQYYVPYLLWGVALCLFNLFLDKNHENIFMKEYHKNDIKT